MLPGESSLRHVRIGPRFRTRVRETVRPDRPLPPALVGLRVLEGAGEIAAVGDTEFEERVREMGLHRAEPLPPAGDSS